MTKRKIDICEYAGQIIKAMQPGILLTTKVGDMVNGYRLGHYRRRMGESKE